MNDIIVWHYCRGIVRDYGGGYYQSVLVYTWLNIKFRTHPQSSLMKMQLQVGAFFVLKIMIKMF